MSSNLTGNGIPVGVGYDSNGDAKGFVELTSISSVSVQLVHTDVTSTTYTVVDSDYLLYVTNSSPVTINLPPAANSKYRVLDINNSGTSTVTVDGNGSETINGSTTTIMSTQYDSITLHCDGIEWRII